MPVTAPLGIENSLNLDVLNVKKIFVDGYPLSIHIRGNNTAPVSSTVEDIPIYSNEKIKSVKFEDGYVRLLNAKTTYKIRTKIENIIFEKHIGSVTFAWYSRITHSAVSTPFTVRGSGDARPAYGFATFEFSINYADVIGLKIIASSLLDSIGRVNITIDVV